MQASKEEIISSNWMKEAQKGYIRVAALILINKRPAHGYEFMKEIKEKTGGFWTPTAGGVYPILRDLENSNYIVGEWETQNNRKLKTYRITDSGRQILEARHSEAKRDYDEHEHALQGICKRRSQR